MSSNLRPRIGSASIAAWLIVLAAAVLVVSTVGGCVVTVIVSAMPEIFMLNFSVTASPTVTTICSCTSVAKPESRHVTV